MSNRYTRDQDWGMSIREENFEVKYRNGDPSNTLIAAAFTEQNVSRQTAT